MSKWKIVRVRSHLHRQLAQLALEMGEYYANHPTLCGPSARESGAVALTDVIEELLRRSEDHKRRARKARRGRTKATESRTDYLEIRQDGENGRRVVHDMPSP